MSVIAFSLRWTWRISRFVLLHVALLLAVGMPREPQAYRDFTILEIRRIQAALRVYRARTGRLPTTAEGLQPLVAANLLDRETRDAWGNRFEYNNDTGVPEILSLGADGAPGGEWLDADISSWDLGNDREPP